MARVLLDHHSRICRPRRLTASTVTPNDVRECTITYTELCNRAGSPNLAHFGGRFYGEIASWCRENGWPPLNSLVVRVDTGEPGEGYNGAGEGFCSTAQWGDQVADCIAFVGYPSTA